MAANTDPRTLNIFGALGLLIADRVFAAVEQAEGVSRQEGVALVQIGLFAPTFGNLQTTLRLSQSATSRLVDRLVARNLAVKNAHPEDPRERILQLTPAGEALLGGILDRKQSSLQELFATLDAGETSRLLDLAEKIFAAGIRSREESDRTCRMCDLTGCPQASCPARHRAGERVAAPAPKRLPAHLL